MKSYTNLEQSKKLAEILPLESADMALLHEEPYETSDSKFDGLHQALCVPFNKYDKSWRQKYKNISYFPCWSLAALLQVLPLGIYDELDGCDYELEIDMIDKMPRYIRLGDLYHSQFPYDFEKDTLLDNIVESIIWLNDNNYFEL